MGLLRTRDLRRVPRHTLLFVVILAIYFIISDSFPEVLRTFGDGKINSEIIRNYDAVGMKASQSGKPIILLWTPFFNNPWKIRSPNCDNPCIFTQDRSLVRKATVLVFHFSDIRLNEMPTFRDERQVWVFFSHEPTTGVRGDWRAFEHVFNWTMSYRLDSDVVWPYGGVLPVHSPKYIPPIDIEQKTKFAFAAVSNRYAFSKRYRILHKLSQINPRIDLFGKDYGHKCEIDSPQCLSTDSMNQYFFRLALENSHCKDYVTEKFWLTLEFNLVPIVDWAPKQRPFNVPPNSYININDFESFQELNEHLLKVSRDSSLFNSYFEWKRNFVLDSEGPCSVCNALKLNTIRKQSTDVGRWLKSDICRSWTIWEYMKLVLDRQLFNIGF